VGIVVTVKAIVGISLVSLALAGCTLQRAYVRPPVLVPKEWASAQALGGMQPVWPGRDWWVSFGDSELNELEEEALGSNHDLKAALSRIAQARATAKIAGSTLYPTVDARLHGERTGKFSEGARSDLFDADLRFAYDLDLWGGLRSSRRAAQADVLAAAEAGANVALILTADIANAYMELCSLDQRIDLARQHVATAQRIDAIVQTRYQSGAVSELDAAQSKTNLATIEVSVLALEQSRLETLNALAILVGKIPSEMIVQPLSSTRVAVPAAVPVGIPSGLLQRRPDIRQAEAILMEAHANIGVARALLFPNIVLTGQGGYASDQLSRLVRSSNGAWTLGASLLAPIFHGGSLRANVDRSTERYNEILQQYQQTILGALRDVETALVDLQKLGAQETLLQEAERQGRRAFELAEIRYRSGATDALTMLNTQNTWLNLQNSVVQTHFGRMSALVSLFKALGGGGQEKPDAMRTVGSACSVWLCGSLR
jgi:outer membrane protein, multidrug efflux system